MNINQRSIELIKEFEGFCATPYKCPADVWTIGYGHTAGVTESMPEITEEEAEALLRKDVRIAENAVLQMVDVPLTDNQFSALVSLTFNIGAANFARSTLLKKLKAADYAGTAEQFERWVYAKGVKLPGLVRRRAAERALFEDEN
jgi:lysozyme